MRIKNKNMTEENKKPVINRQLKGLVVSDAMDKTIVVKVDRQKMHPKYKKSYRVSKKYHVHDEKALAKVGDKVLFTTCRPISKNKCWRLVNILKDK